MFFQVIILRPHPHFTRNVRKKNPQNHPHFTFENPQIRILPEAGYISQTVQNRDILTMER